MAAVSCLVVSFDKVSGALEAERGGGVAAKDAV